MCGIIGFTTNNEALLSRGLDAISHRGPDARGVFSSDQISLGHCRLSIIDLDPASNQPMKRDEITIVFNGEIYNFQDIKEELKAKGCEFTTSGDTEVIIKGYEKYGIEIFKKLRGMWAIALYDAVKGKIILSRDLFGIKPLYHVVIDRVLYFSSEIKGLLQVIPNVEPNTEAYYQFFNLGYFIAPDTCYKNIKKLMPGEVLEWDMNERKITLQVSIMPNLLASKEGISFEESIEVVDQALRDSINAHYVSDVPVGLLLSGGNDSSLIAAISKSLGKNPDMFHLAVQGSTDTYYAHLVAKHLNISLNSVSMDEEALKNQYDKVWDILDEPTGDTSIIPTSLIYSKIKGTNKVVLSGEGGDEFFGGYLRHNNLFKTRQVSKQSFISKIFDFLGQGTSSFALRYFNPIISRMRNLFIQKFSKDLIANYLQSVRIIDYPFEATKIHGRLFSAFSESDQKTFTPAPLFFDLWTYLPNNLMYKNDISSMASSIEARVPFLDRVFMETIIQKIPAKFLLSEQFQSKVILKKVMEKYLPHDLIYRDKRGFGFSPMKYSADQMKIDLKLALQFHHDYADRFGITKSALGLFNPEKSELLIKKYPRFAFAVISNWKIWGKYLD